MQIDLFLWFVIGWIVLAIVLVPIQLRVTAPYGRHTKSGWGILIDNRLGWIIMEVISPIVFAALFLLGSNEKTTPMWIFFTLWMVHYINRSLIFPFRIRTKGKKMPIGIMLSAVAFNVVNGAINGYWLGELGPVYPESWLFDPRFIIGMAVFFTGAGINLWADHRLINLRKPGEVGYKIPKGGVFNWISCPNHFGEIVEWTGFAIMCWNLPALAFAVWTAANLIPRALDHHKWYKSKFENYPTARRAVIPYLL